MKLGLFQFGVFCAAVATMPVYAATLTQAEYDQFIEVQTDIVNETKPILDEPDSHSDASTQRKAFCARLNAYHNIKTTSEENSHLQMANMMHMVATNFLKRQEESLTQSGMTTQVFCANLLNDSSKENTNNK